MVHPKILEAARVTPSENQYNWQSMEFYAFIHFTVNTFTDREWGDGKEDPSLFNPTELNTRQWVNVCKSAGMTGLILTCKHHDGFCLWPSLTTEHSVKNSPWKGGRGDVVREVADACREGGLRFGIYVSPWDRHEPSYGDSEAYNEYFRGQLRELLTEYGELFCVWFDGACGEGPNGKKQVYDWDSYYELIREHQPNAVISVCGPDVRWCGNEAGKTRVSEWSVVPASLQDNEKIQEHSQKVDDGTFAARIHSDDEDLGGREKIMGADRLIWYPAEVNTSIRPGWFYHASEDNKVKSLEHLLDVYYGSVGGNATFLLNLPPDRRGLIHENDAARMQELGDALRRIFSDNLARTASVSASESMDPSHDARHVLSEDRTRFWCTKEGTEQAELEVKFEEEALFDHVVLMEHIRSGQRIESFALEAMVEGQWKPIYAGTIVGYKRICKFDEVRSRRIRLRILASRSFPTLSSFQVYYGG